MQQNDVRNYINGIEYKGLNNVLDRFPTTEGAVVLQSDGTTYQYEYTIKDHLGNARVTYSDANNDGFVGVGDIKQVNHFYPYGLNMEGNWNGSFAEAKNKYQYNGKELNTDFGLNWEDYGARWSDPAIGRWNMVDPDGETNGQISFSSYHYTFDNPIRFNDPDGREGEGCCSGRELYTRTVGALQAVGGAVEMVAGGALILAPEPTTLTKVAGVAVTVHGADQVSAGLKQLFTGKEAETLTSQGLQKAGLSKNQAGVVDMTISVAGTTAAAARAVSAPTKPLKEFSGNSKPWTNNATPNSKYTHIEARSGKAVQNAIYDRNGDVKAHVDFKNHGAGASSGHGHTFPIPGNPASGHGAGKPHIPYNSLPKDWTGLPKGVLPHTPIGH